MLELLGTGLGWNEAAELGIEHALCLLQHRRLNTAMAELDTEAARIASLPFADSEHQQRLLGAIEHRRSALLDRFYQVEGKDRA